MYNVGPVLVQCWASVADGGTTLFQHWINVSCLLGDLYPAFNNIVPSDMKGCICHFPLGYESVSDIPFHIQGDDI